eukprot:1856125-Pleurochrysis_carterae.AAC.1
MHITFDRAVDTKTPLVLGHRNSLLHTRRISTSSSPALSLRYVHAHQTLWTHLPENRHFDPRPRFHPTTLILTHRP